MRRSFRFAPVAGLLLGFGCTLPGRSVDPVSPAPTLGDVPGREWELLGSSRLGRPILVGTFGAGERRVYLIGGIHGDERGGVENAGRLALLLETELPPATSVRFVVDANPDGTATNRRGNAHGVDLNRNWPAANFSPAAERGPEPLSEPESAAVHTDLQAFAPSLVIVLHAARGGPFVNFDGPAREVARAFVEAAAKIDPRWHVVADMGYSTPGSLGSLVGRDWGVPILTIELQRAESGEECWPALRAGLLAALEQ